MSYVNSVNNKTGSATTLTTSAASFTNANFLTVSIQCPSGRTANIVDSGNNSWTAYANSPKIINASTKEYGFYAKNANVSATQTFTAALDAADTMSMQIIGLSGRDTTNPIDNIAFAADASAVANHVGGSIITNSSGVDILVLFTDDELFVGGNNLVYANGLGFIIPSSAIVPDGRASTTGGIEYQNNVTSGTNVTATWTSSFNNKGGAFIISVKSAALTNPITFRMYANGAFQANSFTANVALPSKVVIRLGANGAIQANGLITQAGTGKIKIQANGQLLCNNTIVV
jgi:hypothetical protein